MTIEGKYLFLLAYGVYDIPGKDSNGDTMDDASDDVYQFVIGSLCPVKVTKSGLYYDEYEKKLVARSSGFEIKNPDVGFLFPAFNDRLPDVHNILYYARTEDDRYPDFQEQLVGGVMPPSETLQKGLFAYLVEKSFGRDCDFANVNAVNTALNDLVQTDPEGALEKDRIRNLFKESGASEDVLERFDEAYDEGVTSVGTLKVGNVGGGNNVELKSATMKIQVQSEAAPLLTSKVINGQEYVLVPIQDGLTLNGIALKNARRDKAGGET